MSKVNILQPNNDAIFQHSVIHNAAWQYIMPVVCVAALTFADTTSLFSYGYALLLLVVSGYIISRKEMKDLFFAFHFYLLFAIAFTIIFKSQFPAYLGMTGEEGGIGTDDCRFYAQVVGGEGVGYTIMVSTVDLMPYSLLLKLIYPFQIFTPLNILTPTLLFTAYLPIYVRRLSYLLTNDNKLARLAFLYTLICPFTLYFGCIILRESFTALMVIAGLCYFLQKRYVPLFICVFALIWVRFGTLAFLLCGIVLLYRYQLRHKTRSDFPFVILILVIIGVFYLSFSYFQEFSKGKLEYGLIRSTDNERYEDSTIGALMRLPFPLNILLSTVFFLFIPFLGIPQPHYGHYLVGSFFQGFFTPLFMFFLWKPIFNATLSALLERRHEAAKKILYMAIIFAMILGTISMQSRHKTVLFPILCILAAYGYANKNKKYDGSATILASIVIGVQLIIAVLNYV